MDEQKQFLEEYEQRLADALDQVEQGNITEDYMALIRHACNTPKLSTSKPLQPITAFNFDEIFGDKK
jgi:hypothetical protein